MDKLVCEARRQARATGMGREDVARAVAKARGREEGSWWIPTSFASGVFFTEPWHEILNAWRDQRLELILWPEILAEFQATGDELAAEFPEGDLARWLDLARRAGFFVDAPLLTESVCTNPDDDRFLACALASFEYEAMWLSTASGRLSLPCQSAQYTHFPAGHPGHILNGYAPGQHGLQQIFLAFLPALHLR